MGVTLKSEFRFQISDFRRGEWSLKQISDFRFQISERGWALHLSQISDFRFQISEGGVELKTDFRFQIPDFRRGQGGWVILKLDFRFQISD